MSETGTLKAKILKPKILAPADDLAAPAKSGVEAVRVDAARHRQHRRAAVGVGAPAARRHHLGRNQAVLHHAEPGRRHALDDVRHRHDLAAARRQRLGILDRPRTRDRGRAAARRADRALAHLERDARSVRHRLQRDAAAGVPAAGDAVVRARPVVEGGDRFHRGVVPDPDQHLRGRAQRRHSG